MRDPLSKKIVGVQPSGIRKFFDVANEMKDAISLGVGEPDFDTPWRIREEGIFSLEKGRTFYTSNAGLKELREEICSYLERKIGVSYDPMQETMVTVGGSEAIDVALRCMLDPGDEVLIPQPSYVSYLPCTIMADGVPVIIPLQYENEFKLTVEDLKKAVTPKTKVLVMPFPNNPTGSIMTKADLEPVAEFIKEKTGYDVLGKDTLSFIVSILPRIGQIIMESISSLAINLFVMVFVLYFMLIGGKKMEAYVNDILPFNEANTQEVIHEINMIVRSNAIGIPLLAIIQGGVAMIGYLIFGAPNVLVLGFLTCFATIIPMVGTALIWFPVAAYLAVTGDWFNAIGLAAYGGIVISQSDNLIRFILQKKMADTHPLITIFGVVIGLPLFGFMGVIFGPLLLSLFFLFVDMFKKEYLDLRNNLPAR